MSDKYSTDKHEWGTDAGTKLAKDMTQEEKKKMKRFKEFAQSADKVPQNYRDPETGKTKVRMVPKDKEIIKKEEVELDEGAVISTTVRKEIMKNGGKNVGQNNKEIYFTLKGKKHSVPLYKNFVSDKDYMKLQDTLNEEVELEEKAVSQAQQKFFGMVRAKQKGEMDNASPAVAKAAKSMSKKDVKDFAATKHKGLPKKKDED